MENELFEKTPVPKAYLKLAVPLVTSMIVTMVYNLADTFFISQTGDTDIIAAVSLCGPVFTMLMAFGNIFGQGGSSLISRKLGAKDAEGARRASAFCFYGALLVGAALGVLMLLLQGPALSLLGADDATRPHALPYYATLAVGAPFVVGSFIHSNLLRAEGMSKESMIGTVGGAIVNIILDPVFISVLGMGALGAAIATVLGYIFSVVYFFIIVIRKSRTLSVRPADCRVTHPDAVQIFGIGIPAAITNLCSSACMILTNQYLLPYGNDRIAAMGIVLKVVMIAQLVLTGLAFGGQPLIGYFYGSRNRGRMKELIRFSFLFIAVVAIILSGILFLAANPILRLFLSDAGLVGAGVVMLRWQVSTSILAAFVQLFTIYFQSTGHMLGSFLLSISRQGVVFVLALLIDAALFGYTGIIAAQAAADSVSFLAAAVLFRAQLWKELV